MRRRREGVYIVVHCLFLDGIPPWLHPPISIHLFVCPAITSITLSLPPPFIDPLYCGMDLCSVLPAATETFLPQEDTRRTYAEHAKGRGGNRERAYERYCKQVKATIHTHFVLTYQ